MKLREAPNTAARVLGQYFNGVAVEILDAQGDWSHVSIGGYEGYMMTKFLTRSEENTEFDTFGYARFPESDGKLTVYQSPQSGAEIVDRIDGVLCSAQARVRRKAPPKQAPAGRGKLASSLSTPLHGMLLLYAAGGVFATRRPILSILNTALVCIPDRRRKLGNRTLLFS